jgi:hypothetical protein
MLQVQVIDKGAQNVELRYELNELKKLQTAAKSQWGDMFLTSPPVQWMKYKTFYYNVSRSGDEIVGHELHDRDKLFVPGGIRLRDLAEMLTKEAKNQRARVRKSRKWMTGEKITVGFAACSIDLVDGCVLEADSGT